MSEQSKVRGDRPERVSSPPPKTMFNFWRMTALCSLRLRVKRIQEQTQEVVQNKRFQQVEVQQVPLIQDVPMEEAAPENMDSRSMRACEGSESDITQDVVEMLMLQIHLLKALPTRCPPLMMKNLLENDRRQN
eukprot:1209461-Amphidinium_carterae.1